MKIESTNVCDYCIESGFCGKKPVVTVYGCFDGVKIETKPKKKAKK